MIALWFLVKRTAAHSQLTAAEVSDEKTHYIVTTAITRLTATTNDPEMLYLLYLKFAYHVVIRFVLFQSNTSNGELFATTQI